MVFIYIYGKLKYTLMSFLLKLVLYVMYLYIFVMPHLLPFSTFKHYNHVFDVLLSTHQNICTLKNNNILLKYLNNNIM